MRIHKSTTPTSSPSCTSSSSSTTTTSSSSSLHSSISTHSLTSSTNSTSSSSSPSTATTHSPPRCPGLDLLVKAVSHVAYGSAIAFPYIQRRVIRRRKPASRFTNLIDLNSPQVVDRHHYDHHHEVGSNVLVVVDGNVINKKTTKKKQNRRSKAMAASKYGDSVLQSLKPKKKRSSKELFSSFPMGQRFSIFWPWECGVKQLAH